MSETVKNIVKFTLLLAFGLLLFWLVYRNMDIEKIKEGLQNVKYSYLVFAMFLGILSHISRAIRWNYLLQPMGYKPKTVNTFFAVMVMYLANMALPRLGEVSRCTIMERYEKIPFGKSLGTVVAERSADMFMLLLFTVLVVITQFTTVSSFIANNPEIQSNFQKFISSGNKLALLGAIGLALAVIAYFLIKKFLSQKLYAKIKSLALSVFEGFKSIFKMRKSLLFILHSFIIWTLYFVMVYVAFFAFPATDGLTLSMALTVFVFSSYGMVAPVQGGIGAWHAMVIATLVFYQVDFNQAGAFAFVVHGLNTLTLISLGLISLALLPVVNKTKNAQNKG